MSVTVRSMVSRFLKWAEKALAPNTVAAYRHQLGKVPRSMRDKIASRCRPADLTRWAKTWHECQAVVRLFNWARDEAGIVRTNPFSRVRLPARRGRKRIVGPATLATFLRKSQRAGREFLLAMRETFARPQEIRLATWEQLQAEDPDQAIDAALVEGRALIVQHEYKDSSRRKGEPKPRVLLVSRRLGRLILRIARRSRPRTGPIFLNFRNSPWSKNAVRCLMRRVRRRLGIAKDAQGESVVAYTFRHSLATWAASRGVRDRLLADLLGHVETRTTERYVHLDVAHLRHAVNNLRSDVIP